MFFNRLIPVGLISCCIYIPFVFDCRPILVFFEAFFNVFFFFFFVIVSCICVTVGSIPRLGVLIRIKILKNLEKIFIVMPYDASVREFISWLHLAEAQCVTWL